MRQVEAVRGLRRQIDGWRAFADETLRRRRDGTGFDETAFNARGKQLMDSVRAHLSAMEDREQQLRLARARALGWIRRGVFGGVLLAIFILGPGGAVFLRRFLRRTTRTYQESTEEAQRQAEQMRVTLRSIGDAVIATDAEGRVTFLNPVAEQLTGWRTSEAAGKTLEEVFVIFNEQSGKTAENPVARVLREQKVIGLANHTVLRARDGREIPIEDSAAPILGDAEEVHGVILVFHDVTEARAVQRQIRESRERVDEFLAALSHELRTPLTPVLMTAATLRNEERLPQDVRDQLGMMQRNIELEARLIDDLLDLTRIAHGKLELRTQPCDAHSLVALAVEMVRSEASRKRQTLEVDLAAERSQLHCDPARMQQVFWNLLKNAVKFTPEAGQLSVSSRDTEDRLTLEITDSGVGIPPEAIERIFLPFEQAAASSTDQRFGGLGLGLSISKAILDLHGGRIEAESPGPGQGATFRVNLPALENVLGATPGIASPSDAEGQKKRSRGARLSSLRLLLVEDHEPTLAVLERLLTRSGVSCDERDERGGGLGSGCDGGRFGRGHQRRRAAGWDGFRVDGKITPALRPAGDRLERVWNG